MTFADFMNNIDLSLDSIWGWIDQISTILAQNYIFILLLCVLMFWLLINKVFEVIDIVKGEVINEDLD